MPSTTIHSHQTPPVPGQERTAIECTVTKLPELLAPAGNMEKLRVALHYGADAVYLGGKEFGLRQLADNFTTPELARAVDYCHRNGARAYLTINSYLHNSDLERLPDFLDEIRGIPFDAYIAADPGVIRTIREHSPHASLHLSTQANTVNWQNARFWQEQGIARINLARELSFEEIREIVARVDMEFEVFVHGAMCISYSGRCLLSNIMSGRDANQGACSHPCRWNYALVEETRPGEYFPVFEDRHGTFIFNSKDLCLLPHLPLLVECGVTSLKIEGRMKGINYVASVVRVYREALDRYADDPGRYLCRPEWLEELGKISHRGYTTGFFLGHPNEIDHEYHSRYIRSHDFVGIVEELLPDGSAAVGVRNRLATGDDVEVIGPAMATHRHSLKELTDMGGEPLMVAHPNSRIRVRFPFTVAPLDLLRREKMDDRHGAPPIP
jgi:U32 family peptidase